MVPLWHIENDPFCRAVLRKHWPGVTLHENVKRKLALEPVGLVAGGCPCQSVSLAGKRLHTEDPRWLWPQMLKVIKQVMPRWVLVENVEGLRTKGLCDVLEGLAGLGFDAEWHRVSASTVGAPHQRRRYFVVGYPQGSGRGEGASIFRLASGEWDVGGSGDVVANSSRNGRQKQAALSGSRQKTLAPLSVDWGEYRAAVERWRKSAAGRVLNPLFVEWMLGFPVGWVGLLTNSEPSATRSSRKSRSGSGAASSRRTL